MSGNSPASPTNQSPDSVNKNSISDDHQIRPPSLQGLNKGLKKGDNNSNSGFSIGLPLSPGKSSSKVGSLGGHMSAFLDASNNKAKRKKTTQMKNMSLK
jgi:hypothetical protein